MKINIIGAGMAGLLAANMLRRHEVTIIEKQKFLPNNHHAVLRFRTPYIGEALGIPFEKVNMIKTYVPHLNVVADSLLYARKTTGAFSSDRSILDGTVIAERYVAPPDLIEQMAKDVNIEYDRELLFQKKAFDPTISTIPMPSLMKILGYETKEVFDSIPGKVFTATINDCNAYISVLFPNPKISASRATITGNKLMIEFPGEVEIDSLQISNICLQLGLIAFGMKETRIKEQNFFKIKPINEVVRHHFMKWATVHHNIYSVGRYACWRPKLLLDDLLKDLRIIESWITKGEKK